MGKREDTQDTAYWIFNDKKDLPTMIMIHGFRGTHHGLSLIAENIKSHRVIVPDLPAFGETKPLEKEHNLDNYVEWLHEFIEDLNLKEPPVLAGHSFGSIVVSWYASKYPDTISKLILLCPISAPSLEGPRAIMSYLAAIYYKLTQKLPEKSAAKLLSSPLVIRIISSTMTKSKDKKIRRYVVSQHMSHFSEYYSRQTVGESFKVSIERNVREVADKIMNDTLVIAGAKDDIVSVKDQKRIIEIIPNAKLDIIPNVGHLIHYETPDETAELIESFLVSN